MAIIFNNSKQAKKAKVDHNHTYGGFWLDKSMINVDYDGRTSASNVVKALKLRNYQRAIANFVKILAQRDVPVVFKGTDSYTDNKSVVISADISDKNFDVSAGLALHEASHLKYTDFTVLEQLYKDDTLTYVQQRRIKGMINWIEDRRIDSLVFQSCPGYKAYYHKLYDYYFRTADIARMLKSRKYRQETYGNYEAHIINMMNVSFKSNALQALPEVVKLLDINNITRLNNTAEVAELAKQVVFMIEEHLQQLAEKEEQQEQQQQSDQGTQQGNGDNSQEDNSQEGESQEDNSQEGESQEDNRQEGEDQEDNDLIDELSTQDIAKIQEALRKQRDLIENNNAYEKRSISKGIGNKIKQLQNTETDYVNVGEGVISSDCLIYRLDKEVHTISQYYSASSVAWSDRTQQQRDTVYEVRNTLPAGLYSGRITTRQQDLVAQGYQLGALLGRKLQIRRESRELVTNRLRTGKIDSKRIAHAGYGIENVFNQIHIDKYNKANIHLTIDASGSMGGSKWDNSIKMAMAMAKAISMIDGLELQVSMRETNNNDIPVVSYIYDSRTNKLNHLKMLLEMYDCNSMTPEGLCLEAMLKKKLFIPTTADCDSYLINICDGEPSCGSNYAYDRAINHTRSQVNRINAELGIKHVGFFFGSTLGSSFNKFQQMYGVKQSIAIPDASNATLIAKHMNTQLMAK